MTKKSFTKPEEVLFNDLVALFESGAELAPWRKPWDASKTGGMHRNLITGKEYSGANPMLLEIYSSMRGQEMPLWIGSAQAKQIGCHPVKGCKAARILRPQLNQYEKQDENGKPVINDAGETEINIWTSYKVACVFNIADIKGKDDKAQTKLDSLVKAAMGETTPLKENEVIDNAEQVLRAWPVKTTFHGSTACYSPLGDCISMPPIGSFESSLAFYATWAHEQAHSTGHKSRLNRPMEGQFGSASYAREELVAELASILIGCRLNIGCDIQNHASYLKHWASKLREDGAKSLLKAISEARRAADLITGETTIEDLEEPIKERQVTSPYAQFRA